MYKIAIKTIFNTSILRNPHLMPHFWLIRKYQIAGILKKIKKCRDPLWLLLPLFVGSCKWKLYQLLKLKIITCNKDEPNMYWYYLTGWTISILQRESHGIIAKAPSIFCALSSVLTSGNHLGFPWPSNTEQTPAFANSLNRIEGPPGEQKLEQGTWLLCSVAVILICYLSGNFVLVGILSQAISNSYSFLLILIPRRVMCASYLE